MIENVTKRLFYLPPVMSFLRSGNSAAPSGVNLDKIEMAITECVHFSSQLSFFFFLKKKLIVYRLDTVTDFFNRMVQSVNMDAFHFSGLIHLPFIGHVTPNA